METEQKAEALIELIGGTYECCGKTRIDNEDIMIGDCLAKMDERERYRSNDLGWENRRLLLELWQPCGFTKSLQEIADDKNRTNPASYDQLNPNSQALLDFLYPLFFGE